MNDALLTPEQARSLDAELVSGIYFHNEGFLGSQQARLSYTPKAVMGYIWLVDTANGRDCKGEWKADGDNGTWWMLCKDGLKANGTLTTPRSGLGQGKGKTSKGQLVEFTFEPDEQ